MLNENIIKENKESFLALLNTIDRPGANIQKLIEKLESSDFFTAPASTKYHSSYEGGLCDHSLCVYYNLNSLVKNKGLEDIIPAQSIVIVGLLHDISKMNTYVKGVRNKKEYSKFGSKHDELGNFDWVSEAAWQKKEEKDLFIFGNHEETSAYMIRKYIPLTLEEEVAIINHHGGMGYDSCQGGIASKVLAKYPLAVLLHLADMLATYIDEQVY